MRAMILAAGKGTRLGSMTAELPKPMLPLGDRPVLAWTLERLAASGINEVIINLHHAPTAIPQFFGDGSTWGVQITYSPEPEILGTAGGVKHAQNLLGNETFLVVYGDNVFDWDPSHMLAVHHAQAAFATIAVAEVADASRSGLVAFDAEGRISRFVEKPGPLPDPRGWVNAGVYVLDHAIFDHIPVAQFCDFGFDVFPRLLDGGLRLQAFQLASAPLAIDTPDSYEAAQSRWADRG